MASTLTHQMYNTNRWLNGVNGFGLPLTVDTYTVALAANTDTTLTVPAIQINGLMYATASEPVLAIFNYQAATVFWVSLGATAAVPAGNTLVQSNSTLNPSSAVFDVGDVIHVLSPTANAVMSIAFYPIQQR